MSEEDRSLEKIDQEVEALVKAPERSLGPAGARPPGVSAPADAAGVNYLVMNCVVPGLGTILRGNKGVGAAQLGLVVLGLLSILTGHFLVGLLLGAGGWIWSFVTGLGFLKQGSRSAW